MGSVGIIIGSLNAVVVFATAVGALKASAERKAGTLFLWLLFMWANIASVLYQVSH